MARLTFGDLQNEVYAHVSIIGTDSTVQTNVNRWLNYSQQDICSKWPWTFMFGRETITTVPDYSTGTVSISNGGTTLTGVGTTFTSTMATANQYFIQFPNANDWYNISAYSSATSLTLATPYQNTTLTNSTYLIRKFYYSLSANCDRIIDIRNWNTPLKIIQVDPRTLDDLRPNPESTNSSYGYITYGYDASGNIQISPYPYPSDSRLFEVRETLRPVDMVATTDYPSIPNKYAHLIAWGAIAVGFAYKGANYLEMAEAWSQKYEGKIEEMKKQDRRSEDYQPILRSIDSVQRAKWLQMPEQYPVITSG